jgi:hypothetical protein
MEIFVNSKNDDSMGRQARDVYGRFTSLSS